MFGLKKRRERKARLEAGFLPEWRDLLDDKVRFWKTLDDGERARLEYLALGLMVDKDWEAAQGFALTDEIMMMISTQAAMIILGLPDDSFRGVHSIIVHPTTLVMQGEHSNVKGLASDAPMAILGQASYNGPVLIVWDELQKEARHPGRGHNVVFHEFAHKLDMLDGSVDGTPPLTDQAQFDRWVEVCTKVYERVAAGHGGHSLRHYAGVNPAEFFAVATETFFDNPKGLKKEHLDLYEVLQQYYRQDPAHRHTRYD